MELQELTHKMRAIGADGSLTYWQGEHGPRLRRQQWQHVRYPGP